VNGACIGLSGRTKISIIALESVARVGSTLPLHLDSSKSRNFKRGARRSPASPVKRQRFFCYVLNRTTSVPGNKLRPGFIQLGDRIKILLLRRSDHENDAAQSDRLYRGNPGASRRNCESMRGSVCMPMSSRFSKRTLHRRAFMSGARIISECVWPSHSEMRGLFPTQWTSPEDRGSATLQREPCI
jgi:hypothetical protein